MPLRAPSAVGVKTTTMLHVAASGSVAPQVVDPSANPEPVTASASIDPAGASLTSWIVLVAVVPMSTPSEPAVIGSRWNIVGTTVAVIVRGESAAGRLHVAVVHETSDQPANAEPIAGIAVSSRAPGNS